MKATSVILVALLALGSVQAYPHFWEEHAPRCTALPKKGYKCHAAPKKDTSVSVTITDSSGKVVQAVCPGQSYTIGLEFPDKRFAYVSLSSGAFQKESINIKRCPNAVGFTQKYGNKPSTSFSKLATIPATAPASGKWQVKVTSATGECGAFMLSRATLVVGKC